MDIEEARAWLRGERSWANSFPSQPNGEHIMMCAVADSATTQQATYIVKYHEDQVALREGREGSA